MVDSILEHADGAVIVNKSTAPVGTVHRIKSRIAQSVAAPARFQVISNPEFLKEGSAVDDCMRPDRIIIGGAEPAEVALLRELYLPFSRNREKLMIMDARSAELTKYAANCMLATKISFINEIANLAEHLGADIEMVRRGIGSDPRIGYDFIYAGCGFGGSCFPKDLQALRRSAELKASRRSCCVRWSRSTNIRRSAVQQDPAALSRWPAGQGIRPVGLVVQAQHQ